MSTIKAPVFYSEQEERLNIWTHAFGMVMSCIALVFLLVRAISLGTTSHIISFAIFGISFIILYAASTFYHKATEPKKRTQLRVFDHAAIFVMIAGSYTPFTVNVLENNSSLIFTTIVWTVAIIGIILKIFFTGKFNILSTIMYVGMGWIAVFAAGQLMANLSSAGLTWLLAGGIAYTIGAVLYSIKKIKFNHAIFHVFVLIGSFCHFMAVYFHILPK